MKMTRLLQVVAHLILPWQGAKVMTHQKVTRSCPSVKVLQMHLLGLHCVFIAVDQHQCYVKVVAGPTSVKVQGIANQTGE